MTIPQDDQRSDAQRIWDAAKATPDLTTPQLCKATGLDKSVVNSAVARMVHHRGLMEESGEAPSEATTGRHKGKMIATYRAIGDEYPTKQGAASHKPKAAPAKATKATKAKPAPAPTEAPVVVAAKSRQEAAWNAVKAAQGTMTGGKLAQALNIPRNLAAAALTTLVAKGKARAVGESEPNANGRTSTLYEAVGDSYNDPAHQSAPTVNGHKKNGHAAPSVTPPETSAPIDVETRKRRRVQWSQEEIEACVAQWARDHVAIRVGFSEHALRRVALLEGHGYRPRKFQAQAARDFVAKYAPQVEELAKEYKANPALLAKPPVVAAEAVSPGNAAPPGFVPEAPKPASSLGELIEQALTSIVGKVVADTLGAQLAGIEQRLSARVAAVLQAIPGQSVGMTHRPPPAAATLTAPVAEEERRERAQVLIVNALPAQFESVKRAFPDLDLRLHRDKLPGEPDPDLVISLTKFMSHPLDRSLRRKYGPRYCPVNGAADSVKNAITARLHIAQRQHH